MNDSQQRTPEWYVNRLGKLTASYMDSALYFKKNGEESQERYNLKIQILSERLTGLKAYTYENVYMKDGRDHEPIAKEILEQLGFPIQEVGLIDHPTIKMFGASPDALSDDDGLIEIKCPKTETHLKYMLRGVVPEEHKPQMLAQLACTGRKWVDFISFDPRIKDKAIQIFVRRYTPTPKEIEAVEKAAIQFLSEIDKMEYLIKDLVL
ncbi:MAG TPA: YqaJ viral recombinase family protein [Cyclobacteriaceae bacterium]|nr:YqaJ viral recombinase family protein [Cyclobacteriaceae bacterium]